MEEYRRHIYIPSRPLWQVAAYSLGKMAWVLSLVSGVALFCVVTMSVGCVSSNQFLTTFHVAEISRATSTISFSFLGLCINKVDCFYHGMEDPSTSIAVLASQHNISEDFLSFVIDRQASFLNGWLATTLVWSLCYFFGNCLSCWWINNDLSDTRFPCAMLCSAFAFICSLAGTLAYAALLLSLPARQGKVEDYRATIGPTTLGFVVLTFLCTLISCLIPCILKTVIRTRRVQRAKGGPALASFARLIKQDLSSCCPRSEKSRKNKVKLPIRETARREEKDQAGAEPQSSQQQDNLVISAPPKASQVDHISSGKWHAEGGPNQLKRKKALRQIGTGVSTGASASSARYGQHALTSSSGLGDHGQRLTDFIAAKPRESADSGSSQIRAPPERSIRPSLQGSTPESAPSEKFPFGDDSPTLTPPDFKIVIPSGLPANARARWVEAKNRWEENPFKDSIASHSIDRDKTSLTRKIMDRPPPKSIQVHPDIIQPDREARESLIPADQMHPRLKNMFLSAPGDEPSSSSKFGQAKGQRITSGTREVEQGIYEPPYFQGNFVYYSAVGHGPLEKPVKPKRDQLNSPPIAKKASTFGNFNRVPVLKGVSEYADDQAQEETLDAMGEDLGAFQGVEQPQSISLREGASQIEPMTMSEPSEDLYASDGDATRWFNVRRSDLDKLAKSRAQSKRKGKSLDTSGRNSRSNM